MIAVPSLPLRPGSRGGLRLPGLPSWPWRITWTYLTLILFLPLAGMLLRAAGVGPAAFWEAATSPEAIASYQVSFGIAALASLVNGLFGLVVAWALIRCRFPGQRLLDSLIDRPSPCPRPWPAWPSPTCTAPKAGWGRP